MRNMDINRISSDKNKLILNQNSERLYLAELIPPLLGRWARLLFVVKKTFSEDLSENPLAIILDDTGVAGLHDAIKQRCADLGIGATGDDYQTPETFTLAKALNKLSEPKITDTPEAV
jgi:hypothetical protein